MSLIFFYGTECPHCHTMVPLVEQLEHEEHLKVERLEVWHDDKNMAVLEGYDKGKCGGVPYFYNTDTGASICGEAEYDELKEWAQGKMA